MAVLPGDRLAAPAFPLVAALAAAFALLGTACASEPEAGNDPGEPPPPTAPEPVQRAPAPEPPEPPEPSLSSVRVVDGDTGRAVRAARVTAARSRARTDQHGRALVEAEGTVRLRVSARGYEPLVARVKLGRRGREVRLYRPAVQWPIYGATPSRTQAHPGIEVRPPFRVVWSRGLRSLIEFPAVVWEGIAYVNTYGGRLYAISMGSGRIVWRTRVGSKVASSPAVVPERRELLVVTMSPGDFKVLDLETGKLKWRYSTGLTEPSPVVRGSIAYFAATNGRVYAVDLRRRRPKWVARTGAKITSSPALAGRRLYVGDYAGRVFAFDARRGRRVWTGSAGSRVYGTVAVAGGRVFAPSVFSGLSALSARSGRLLWRIPVGVYLYSSPAVYRGRVYFGTYAGLVYCVSARSGRILWRRSAGGAVSGAVQVVGGVVYAGSFGRRITAWHWRSGRQLWRFPRGRYVPVSGNGGRLLLHGSSRVYAVEPRGRR
jgi:outer membrane protein assembly factor BamB